MVLRVCVWGRAGWRAFLVIVAGGGGGYPQVRGRVSARKALWGNFRGISILG